MEEGSGISLNWKAGQYDRGSEKIGFWVLVISVLLLHHDIPERPLNEISTSAYPVDLKR